MLKRPTLAPLHRLSLAALALFTLAGAAPAAADWLVTRGGARVETRGPWKVEGERVLFTDIRGTVASLRVAEVDLEASAVATIKAKAPRPAAQASPGAAKPKRPAVKSVTDADVAHATPAAAAAEEASRITLYATSWCGYCQKTRELLKELNVPYMEKDIEKSAEGRDEYLAKGKGYRGVPLLDIGGTIVRGYDAKEIRQRIAALDQKPPATPGRGAE